MTKKPEIKNPDAPATSKQTWMIRSLRQQINHPDAKKDTRTEGFTMGTASVEIEKLLEAKKVREEKLKELGF